MLPSMPCLGISDSSNDVSEMKQHIQNNNDEIVDKSDNDDVCEDKKNNALSEILHAISNEQIENKTNVTVSSSNIIEVCDKDNVDEINALMVASSTIKNVREKKELFSIADKKKAKKKKEYLASLAMLLPPDPSFEKEKIDQLAQAYLEKLKDTLDETDFSKVMHFFESIDGETPVELYTKIKPILDSKYQDLTDEFLLFLNTEQANSIGKLIPFFIINHMAKFLRNLEIYFKDQPSQLRKIHKSLLEMQQTSNITLEKVKTVILPLLRGNPLLCDGFLQIFLEESPPSILLNDTHENIDVNKELNKADEEVVFESIAVSDVEDTACVCPCHKVDEQQPIKQHCLHCGLRFLQGKVYCQTGRGLKAVNVTFPHDLDIDHNARLGVVNKLKRLDHIQSHPKTHSPSREGLDEHRSYKYIGDIDKGKNSKGCRSPKKTKPNAKKLCAISKDKDFLSKSIKSSPKKLTGDLCKQNKRKRIDFCDKSCSVLINKPDICSKQIESLVDVIGRQNLPPPEYLDIHSSDSDFSQDECTDCKKRKSKFSKNKSNWDMWSREEDKIILQTFQQKFSEEAIQLIANQLKNRSANEIRSRFETLMMLLQEMECT